MTSTEILARIPAPIRASLWTPAGGGSPRVYLKCFRGRDRGYVLCLADGTYSLAFVHTFFLAEVTAALSGPAPVASDGLPEAAPGADRVELANAII